MDKWRRGAAVLGQQRGVQVEGAQPWHGPHHLGQHAESNHDLQVGPQAAQGFDKGLVFELHGLQQGQPLGEGIAFHVALVHVVAAAGRLIGHGDHAHDIVAAFHKPLQALDGKVGRAEEYDS